MSGNYPPPAGDPNQFGSPAEYGQPGYGQPGQYGSQYGTSGYQGVPGNPDFLPAEQAYYAQQTWGSGYYGDPRYGSYGPSPNQGVQTNAIIALIVSGITFFCCNLLAVAGVILSIISLTKWQQEPDTARKLNMWAWISTGVGLGLVILFYVLSFFLPFLAFIPLLSTSTS